MANGQEQINKLIAENDLNQLDVSLLPACIYNLTVIYEGNKTTKQVIKR